MKTLVFSDVHLNEDSADVVLGKILPNIRQEALRRGINQLAMLGDLWHVRYRVDVRIQNALRDELKQWESAGLDLRILPGNHDQVDRAGRNALEVFDDLRKVRVYTEPTADGDGVWVPYRKRGEDVVQILETLAPRAMNLEGRRVCWAHVAVQGAYMNDTHFDSDGLPVSVFQHFDRVLMGHYHKRQSLTYENTTLWYVGSVREVTASEAGQDKGFAIWDGDQLEFVATDWAPRIHRIELKKGQQFDPSRIRPGDDVRVTVDPEIDIETLGKYLEQLNVRHTITPAVEVTQSRLDVGDSATIAQYAKAYVERVAPEHADKARLMDVFRTIVEK